MVNDRMGARKAWGAKRAFAPRLEIGIKTKYFWKNLKSVS